MNEKPHFSNIEIWGFVFSRAYFWYFGGKKIRLMFLLGYVNLTKIGYYQTKHFGKKS